MAANKKLTAAIKGRRVIGVDGQAATTLVHFDDGSTMTVHTDATASPPGRAPLGVVKKVRQRDTTLSLDYEDGTTLELRTAEPTSSVMLRANGGALEYAD